MDTPRHGTLPPPPPKLIRLGRPGPIDIRQEDTDVVSILGQGKTTIGTIDWGQVWVQELQKPTVKIEANQYRLNPEDEDTYLMVGATEKWVWCQGTRTTMPLTFARSKVEVWEVVTAGAGG